MAVTVEPWLFAIDANGTIVERLEGGIGISELEPMVAELGRQVPG